MKKLTGGFDYGLGAVLIGEHSLASFLSKNRGKAFRDFFNSIGQKRPVIDIRSTPRLCGAANNSIRISTEDTTQLPIRLTSPGSHGRACASHPDNTAQCLRNQDTRDKPAYDSSKSFWPIDSMKPIRSHGMEFNPWTSSRGAVRSTASRRMDAGTISPVAVLRDARKGRAPLDEVIDMIRTSETMYWKR